MINFFNFAEIIIKMEQSCETKVKPKTFKELIKSRGFLRPLLGIVLGGIAGFLYYYYVGCATGSCAISSSPYFSTIWGALFGYFILNSPCRRC